MCISRSQVIEICWGTMLVANGMRHLFFHPAHTFESPCRIFEILNLQVFEPTACLYWQLLPTKRRWGRSATQSRYPTVGGKAEGPALLPSGPLRRPLASWLLHQVFPLIQHTSLPSLRHRYRVRRPGAVVSPRRGKAIIGISSRSLTTNSDLFIGILQACAHNCRDRQFQLPPVQTRIR